MDNLETSNEPLDEPHPGATERPAVPARGFRRVPSFRRLAFVSLTSLALGVGSLVGGLTYIKTVVPIASERNVNTGPAILLEKAGTLAFPQQVERMNILVLGIDNNYDQKGIMYTKGARSDTMMLVSLSSEAKFLNVVSIPRDCYVLLSNALGYEKINAAYSFGGPKQAMETVSQFLNVPVDHYLVVKIAGAKKMLDAIGGLPIDVEKDMDYDDSWGHLHVHLKKGPQVLTGEEAVGYARFRKDEEGDRGRIRRQQQVIRALVDRLKSPKIAMNLPGMARAAKETLETDLQIPEMLDLAHLYRGFDQKKMRAGQVEGDDTMINNQAMIIPYPPSTEKLVRSLLKDADTLAPRDMRICVLNGSKEAGAAQKLADRLTEAGLQVVKVELADKDNYATTEVVEHTKTPRMHGRLAGMLSGATFKEGPPPKGQEFDITIVVGNDKTLASLHDQAPSTRDYNLAPRREIPARNLDPVNNPARTPEPDRRPRDPGQPPTDQDDPALRVAPRTPAGPPGAPDRPADPVPPAPDAPPPATPVPPPSSGGPGLIWPSPARRSSN